MNSFFVALLTLSAFGSSAFAAFRQGPQTPDPQARVCTRMVMKISERLINIEQASLGLFAVSEKLEANRAKLEKLLSGPEARTTREQLNFAISSLGQDIQSQLEWQRDAATKVLNEAFLAGLIDRPIDPTAPINISGAQLLAKKAVSKEFFVKNRDWTVTEETSYVYECNPDLNYDLFKTYSSDTLNQ